MKQIIFEVAFFAACTIACGVLLWWGFTCPEYWENPDLLLNACKVVGYVGLVAFPALCVDMVRDELMFMEEESDES